MSSSLTPPDSHHLSAARGWLELGNPTEAGEEIARISSALLDYPEVLDARYEICAALGNWQPALEIAERMAALHPERPCGWLHRAYALRRAPGGGLPQAWEALRPARERFPKEPVIPYNLACYAAQMGRIEEAWDWLRQAMTTAGDAKAIKDMALADADLQPLWERIRAR